MADKQQRVPKGGRNCQRAARQRARLQSTRTARIRATRERKLKNARRSCGEKFAKQLEIYYQRLGPNPDKKAGKAEVYYGE